MQLSSILGGLEEDHRRRIQESLALLNLQAVHSAGLQGKVGSLLKEDNSPVTVIDLLHQSQLQGLLASRFAGDALICEEPRSLQEQVLEEATRVSREIYGLTLAEEIPVLPTQAEVTWILDPIDGTKGFLGGRCFAIALAYFVGDEPFFGALAVPGADAQSPRSIDTSLAFAVRGGGAFKARVSAEGDPDWQPLRSSPWRGDALRVAVSLAHGGGMSERLEREADLELVKLDSQAKYAAVAHDEIDAYMRSARDDGYPDVVWDHLPGALVAIEAGCRVCHFDGGEIRFRREDAVGFRGGFICCRDSPSDALLQRLQGIAVG